MKDSKDIRKYFIFFLFIAIVVVVVSTCSPVQLFVENSHAAKEFLHTHTHPNILLAPEGTWEMFACGFFERFNSLALI